MNENCKQIIKLYKMWERAYRFRNEEYNGPPIVILKAEKTNVLKPLIKQITYKPLN